MLSILENGRRYMPWIIAFLGFVLCLALGREKSRIEPRVFIKSCRDFTDLMMSRGKQLGWYRRKERWLKKNGANFHLGKKISPFRYQCLRMFLGLTGLVVFSVLGTPYGPVAMVVCYFAPDLLVLYGNSQDNRKLLPELKLIYHALEIQIRAGVYVTSALAECYGCVREKRIKQALLDLAGEIVVHADLYSALTDFQEKFDNRHIDSLCIIILQAMESGQAVDLLSDLAEQIKDMELSLLAGKKESLDRSITFYQLGILAAVMGVVLYACVTQMFQAALHL